VRTPLPISLYRQGLRGFIGPFSPGHTVTARHFSVKPVFSCPPVPF
jgi:hypothetical protein